MEFDVKRLMIRVLSLFKGFVLALIFSVFLQASLANADGVTYNITNKTELAAIGGEDGTPLSGEYVVTKSFGVDVATGSTYVTGTFTGTFDGGGFTISGLTQPLFDVIGVSDGIGGNVSDLNLASGTDESGVIGKGALANTLEAGGNIDNVSSSANVTDSGEGCECIPGIGGLVGTSYGTITNSDVTGNVTGTVTENVGGLVGYSEGVITNSYTTGLVTGTENVGGLVGSSDGVITDSYATGTVDGTSDVGGLVGSSDGAITNSYATGAVRGLGPNDPDTWPFEGANIGGLVGSSDGAITNSYATGAVEGTEYVGGLVGDSFSTITNSYATGAVEGTIRVGGLVGRSEFAITNSYATGAVTGLGPDNPVTEMRPEGGYIGGLVGETYSTSTISNSYATGDVEGTEYIGGLVGYLGGDISNSYATGDVEGTEYIGGLDIGGLDIGGLVGYSNFKDGGAESDEQISLESYSTGTVTINGNLQIGDMYAETAPAPYILDIINTPFGEGFVPAFAVNASINDGLPCLMSLEDSCDVEETPSFNLRSYYTQAAKSLDKALTPFGFKSNFSSHPTLGFQALDQNQSKLPATIQLFEVSEYQNSRILLNKEDGFQLSISSYYKEAVEIWTQGFNGEYLYLGLIEFDKDGKAILPTLKFDTANTYQLLMIKAADKVSEKPNLERKIGEITINVI